MLARPCFKLVLENYPTFMQGPTVKPSLQGWVSRMGCYKCLGTSFSGHQPQEMVTNNLVCAYSATYPTHHWLALCTRPVITFAMYVICQTNKHCAAKTADLPWHADPPILLIFVVQAAVGLGVVEHWVEVTFKTIQGPLWKRRASSPSSYTAKQLTQHHM